MKNLSIKTYIVLSITLLSLIVFLQNTRVVKFRIFFWKIEMSQIILLFITTFIGIVIGLILARIFNKSKKEE